MATKILITLLTVLSLAAALPQASSSTCTTPSTSPSSTPSNVPFHILAISNSPNSTIPINFLPITASGLALNINGTTASYCPSAQVSPCPPGTSTSVIGGITSQSLSMNVEVPGGQLVYVTPSGRIMYTQAHSAAMYPQDSYVTAFVARIPVTRGFGELRYFEPAEDGSSTVGVGEGTGFSGCPDATVVGQWTLWAKTRAFAGGEGCVDVDLAIPLADTDTGDTGVHGVEAWQYT